MILATSAAVWMPASYGWPVEGPQEEVQFANWLRGLREEALEAGISEATVEVALSGITPVKVAPIARDCTQDTDQLNAHAFLQSVLPILPWGAG